MNSPTTIPTKEGNLQIFAVPSDASRIIIHKNELRFIDGGDGVISSYPVPEGSEILGEIEDGRIDWDVTDFIENTDDVTAVGGGYKNYEKDNSYHASSNDSFLSLLRSYNIDTAKGRWVCVLID